MTFFSCLLPSREAFRGGSLLLGSREMSIEKPETGEHHKNHRPNQKYIGQRVWPRWQVFELEHGTVLKAMTQQLAGNAL